MENKKIFCFTLHLLVIIVFVVSRNISASSFPKYNEPVKIMPLGDSITTGYGTPDFSGYRKPLYHNLIKMGYNVDFVGTRHEGHKYYDDDHQGHGGYTSSDINRLNRGLRALSEPFRLSSWLEYSHPDIVLYHIGTNDLKSSNSNPKDVAYNVNKTLSIIYDFDSDITVMLAKIILTQFEDRNIRIREYNSLLQDNSIYWANKGYSIMLVDMENALEYNDYFDEIHPNEKGYEKMAEIWYDSIVYLFSIEDISSIPDGIYNEINIDNSMAKSLDCITMSIKNLSNLMNQIKALDIQFTDNEEHSGTFKYKVVKDEILDGKSTWRVNLEFGEGGTGSVYTLWVSKSTGKTIQVKVDNLILFGNFAQLIGNTTFDFWTTKVYYYWITWDFNVIYVLPTEYGILSYLGTKNLVLGPTTLFIYNYRFEGYDTTPEMYRYTVEGSFAPTQFGCILTYLIMESLETQEWFKLELMSIELAEPQEPPEISEGKPIISTMSVETDEEFSLGYNVSNDGSSFAIHYLPLIVDGEVVESQIVQLMADETKIFNFTMAFEVEGEHLVEIGGKKVSIMVRATPPAAFTQSNLIVNPSYVNIGEHVNVSVKVTNTGGKSGLSTINLKIDGEIHSRALIVLNPNESKIVSFDIPTTKIGTFSVDINGLQGNFTVTKLPEFKFVPSPSNSQERPYKLILVSFFLTVLFFLILKVDIN